MPDPTHFCTSMSVMLRRWPLPRSDSGLAMPPNQSGTQIADRYLANPGATGIYRVTIIDGEACDRRWATMDA